MTSTYTIPGGEPFFFPGGPVGCLLVHGFTGAPNEMRWLGEYLHGRGHSVLGVRLAGHGTNPADMLRLRWTDWMANIEDGLSVLRGCTDQQYILGLSLGGALTLLSAARYPIAGAAAYAAPYCLPDDWRVPYIRQISRVMPRMTKTGTQWRNPEAAATHVEYPFYPTIALAEMRDLLVEMRAALPRVNVPVLLAQSREDKVVPPDHMETIYTALGSQDKQMVWVENSTHVLLREPPREIVFAATADFIERTANRP